MDFYVSMILAIILGGLLVILYYMKKENKFEKHGIPYIKPLPIFGNMFQALFRIIPHFEIIRKFYYINTKAKYVGFYDFSDPVLIIRDPELAKNITVKNFDYFVDHRGFVNPTQDPFFGKNLFSLCGDNWREIRNLLSPAFTSSKMKAMFKLMGKCSQDFSNYMYEETQKKKTLTINSKEIFARYTNDVIATCAFGIDIDSMRNPENEFYVLGKEATNFEGLLSLKFLLLRNFPIISRLLRVKLMNVKIEKFFNKIVRDTIAIRDEKGISRPDMIQLLMESRNNNINGHGPDLTIEDMTAQAFVFFFGGFDTSSSLMCFVAHEISKNNEVQAKLYNEIDNVHIAFDGEPTYEAINSMQYLDAVINETVRLYPIAHFLDRICTKNFELPPTLPGTKPLQLKPGDSVFIPVQAFQSDPQYFHDPDKFIPERFIDDPKRILHSSSYIPFGDGPRMCIGNRFALLETKVLIYHLLMKCVLKPSKKMINPMKFSTASVPILPKGGFWLDLQPRNEK